MLLQAYSYVRVMAGEARSKIHDRFLDLTQSETGATAAEYALLVSLIAVAIILGATALGGSINSKLDSTATTIGP
jgi:pilus assembly protein Flp/PilA